MKKILWLKIYILHIILLSIIVVNFNPVHASLQWKPEIICDQGAIQIDQAEEMQHGRLVKFHRLKISSPPLLLELLDSSAIFNEMIEADSQLILYVRYIDEEQIFEGYSQNQKEDRIYQVLSSGSSVLFEASSTTCLPGQYRCRPEKKINDIAMDSCNKSN